MVENYLVHWQNTIRGTRTKYHNKETESFTKGHVKTQQLMVNSAAPNHTKISLFKSFIHQCVSIILLATCSFKQSGFQLRPWNNRRKCMLRSFLGSKSFSQKIYCILLYKYLDNYLQKLNAWQKKTQQQKKESFSKSILFAYSFCQDFQNIPQHLVLFKTTLRPTTLLPYQHILSTPH